MSERIRVTFDENLRRRRLVVLFRALLALVPLIAVWLWSLLAQAAALLNWLATLVLGRSPAPLHRFLAAFLEYSTGVTAWILLLSSRAEHPVKLEVPPLASQPRLVTLLRLPLALPALVLASVFAVILATMSIGAWFVALIFGRTTAGMQELGAFCLRYGVETQAYLLLLTPRYPRLAPPQDAKLERAVEPAEPGEPESEGPEPAALVSGGYRRFAADLSADLGRELVGACGIGPRAHVLHVGAGAAAVAIAAETGAPVVVTDPVRELLDAARREARERRVRLQWVEAEATSFPFGDDAFDVVTSALGLMDVADHERAVSELLRVCRPGGTIGLVNWTPDGWVGELGGVIARYGPALPGAPPFVWGSEEHVTALLGARVESLRLSRKALVLEEFSDESAAIDGLEAAFGALTALRRNLESDPDRSGALSAELEEFAVRANRGSHAAPVYELEYLVAVARKRA